MIPQTAKNNAVIVLTTWPDEAGAEAFAKELMEEKLAACVNILPRMKSIYIWEGEVESGTEHQLIIKTTTEVTDVIASKLKSKHPYTLAEFICLPIEMGGGQYLSWINSAVNTP